MSTKELYSIREWAPLTDIIEKIPARITRALGIFPADLNITCVDAIAEFLALGSDAGVVFWYNRHTGDLQKLRTEYTTRITCVKIVNSVEYMVAAGNSNGQVSVFQIQKELPANLNLVAPCTRAKPIERYTIRELHRSTVSCCEWSKNGMKLYSGDRQGVVVLTEFDFQAHISKSAEILSETYEIVQLSVHQSYLLVSTLYRSIVCQRHARSGQWHVTQVGKKDRKQLTDCGGIFLKRHTKHPLLICSRPGLRFWIADTEGNVEKTLLFRDAVAKSPTWEIPILNPKAGITRRPPLLTENNVEFGMRNFCNLYLYAGEDSLVVTHDESALYILNLDRLRVEAAARGFRKILDFCVCEKEIFILEGARSLLRLAPLPEKPSKVAKVIFNPSMPPPVPLLGAAFSGAFESGVEYAPENQPITKAEECFELPPVEALNLNVQIELAVESPRAEQNRRLEIFNQISDMDFDQSILHHSGISQSVRKKRKSRERQLAMDQSTKSQGIVEIAKAVTAAPDTTSITTESEKPSTQELTTKPTLMDTSFCVPAMPKSCVSAAEPKKDTSQLQHNANATALESSHNVHEESLAEELNAALKLKPDTNQIATVNSTYILPKQKTLAEELQLAGLNLYMKKRIENEPSGVAEISEFTTTSAKTPPAPAPTPSSLTELSQAYPRQPQVEDAGVQTTPRKKIYYFEDADDYNAGQPIDEICHNALRAAALVEDFEENAETDTTAMAAAATSSAATTQQLHFVHTQPMPEEIDSFLPDFRRAYDPCTQRKNAPPSSDSNGSSSEWEFLDN